jgi:23S rRNA pseudouridine2604 synthase
MRINKYISETGFCSRREADRLVADGKVTLNGKKAQLGDEVQEGDKVLVNGKPLTEKKKHVYIALNKPVGITSTTERHVEGNIIDFVNHPERVFHVGRLDKDSDGLILLTNDGDIVNKILRAENDHEKEYIVTVDRAITKQFLFGMANGVKIDGVMTRKCKITYVSTNVFRIILTEGRNRQIRKMCEAFGYTVVRLQRIRIMNIKLGNLRVGQWRNLTTEELKELFKNLNYKPREL